MKNNLVLVFLFIMFFSCKDTDAVIVASDSQEKEIDNTIVGANTDSRGCLTTAGYTWSKLKKDCIRLFNSAIRLYPKTNPATQDALLVSYLILSDDGMEAEVFIPNHDQSLVLIRTNASLPFVFNDYELTAFEGFTLRQNGEVIYLGDGEIGPKFTGRDRNDD